MNVTLKQAPELPMVKEKRNGYTCKVTNMKYLNQTAVDVFNMAIEDIKEKESIHDITIALTGMEDEEVETVCDILTSVKYECSKRGTHMVGFFFNGIQRTIYEGGEAIISLSVGKTLFSAVKRCASKKEIDLIDLAIAESDELTETLTEWEVTNVEERRRV